MTEKRWCVELCARIYQRKHSLVAVGMGQAAYMENVADCKWQYQVQGHIRRNRCSRSIFAGLLIKKKREEERTEEITLSD